MRHQLGTLWKAVRILICHYAWTVRVHCWDNLYMLAAFSYNSAASSNLLDGPKNDQEFSFFCACETSSRACCSVPATIGEKKYWATLVSLTPSHIHRTINSFSSLVTWQPVILSLHHDAYLLPNDSVCIYSREKIKRKSDNREGSVLIWGKGVVFQSWEKVTRLNCGRHWWVYVKILVGSVKVCHIVDLRCCRAHSYALKRHC